MKTKKQKLIFSSILFLTALIIMVQTTFATTFSGGRPSAKFNAYYDSSVATYGYTSNYDSARSNWNALSNSVNIGKQNNTTDYPDKYYIGTTVNEPDSCLLGQQIPYRKNILGVIVGASNSQTWVYSTVAMYHNSMTDCLGYNMSNAQITSNATHELGHTLALDHPTTTSSSVMKQGVQSIGPQSYDFFDIAAKWGP